MARKNLGIPKVKGRRSNRWFYGLLVLLLVIGYVAVSWVAVDINKCSTGRKVWVWDKVPPGYACATVL